MGDHVNMDDYIRLDEFGEFYYREKPVSRNHRVSLNWMCREGSLKKHAKKICNKWFVNKEALNGTE